LPTSSVFVCVCVPYAGRCSVRAHVAAIADNSEFLSRIEQSFKLHS
jgi:hypothetical protein